MYRYLRAIGYTGLHSRAEAMNYLSHFVTRDSGRLMNHECGLDMGVMIYLNPEFDQYTMEYFFPYARGDRAMRIHDLAVEERSEGPGYFGVIEDERNLLLLSFLCTNPEMLTAGDYPECSVYLSGFSLSGKILLPAKEPVHEKISKTDNATRNRHFQHSDIDDVHSKDSLIEYINREEELYHLLRERMKTESLYRIIETTLMPYGVECDTYHVLGNILAVDEIINRDTGEIVLKLDLETYGYKFPVYINSRDILGEPLPGRRFKGNVRLQGVVETN
ncbi:MAG: DUF3881 family protein [Eubacteriales bacterium]|nr:DUF3881 family protein [Eubacteriales bacterium]